MTAKEFLRQYEYASLRVKRLEKEYEEEQIMIDAVRSTSDNDGMPHGTNTSKPTEDKAVRLAEKAERLFDARIKAIETRQEVFEVIDQIDGVEGDVLYEKYINLKSWDDVAITLGYSRRHVVRIHGDALQTIRMSLNVT